MTTEETFLRQRDIFNPEDHRGRRVHIFGCGTIGSFSTIALAKMGVSDLVIYDFDKVEEHNVSNQFFKRHDIGKAKTDAVADITSEMIDCRVRIAEGKIDARTQIEFSDGDVAVLAFDNLEARKIVYSKALASGKKISLIDGRMGGELLRLYIFKKLAKDADYEISLNTKVEPNICTARSICYNGIIIAGLIASVVKKILKDESVPREIDFSLRNYDFTTVKE